jgi:hypothetical protein
MTECYSPDPKPPSPRVPRPPDETVWSIAHDHVEWCCEFRFQVRATGKDVRIVREREFFASHRFVLRASAEKWASGDRPMHQNRAFPKTSTIKFPE